MTLYTTTGHRKVLVRDRLRASPGRYSSGVPPSLLGSAAPTAAPPLEKRSPSSLPGEEGGSRRDTVDDEDSEDDHDREEEREEDEEEDDRDGMEGNEKWEKLVDDEDVLSEDLRVPPDEGLLAGSENAKMRTLGMVGIGRSYRSEI